MKISRRPHWAPVVLLKPTRDPTSILLHLHSSPASVFVAKQRGDYLARKTEPGSQKWRRWWLVAVVVVGVVCVSGGGCDWIIQGQLRLPFSAGSEDGGGADWSRLPTGVGKETRLPGEEKG